jgi:hypothetical protein
MKQGKQNSRFVTLEQTQPDSASARMPTAQQRPDVPVATAKEAALLPDAA